MSTQLFALGDRARWTTAVAFLALAAGLGTTPTASRAAGAHPAPVRIAGVGPHSSRATDVTPLARQRLDAPVAVGAALVALTAVPFAMLLGARRRRRGRAVPVRESTPVPGQESTPVPGQESTPVPERVRSDQPRRKVAPPSRGPAEVGRSAPPIRRHKRVIGYLTVPADLDSDETSASSDAIKAACVRAGWKLTEVVRDRENGRILQRPGLRYALERIASDKANALVISELQHVSRSIVDLGALMAWFRDTQATLIALDLRLDTSTREGYHVASTLIALSDWERERIASRTRNGLAELRALGQPTGRPAVSDRPELLERICAMREAKLSLRAIADQLNAEQVPTLRGGKEWRPSSIQAALGYRRPGPRDHLPPSQKVRRA
jgi:DNA invertase Pin-like site-specific DNA recombinase